MKYPWDADQGNDKNWSWLKIKSAPPFFIVVYSKCLFGERTGSSPHFVDGFFFPPNGPFSGLWTAAVVYFPENDLDWSRRRELYA